MTDTDDKHAELIAEKAANQVLAEQLAEQTAIFEQFTQTLEEANWLRRLVKHFETRDVRHSVNVVAKEVLPELRQLILADSIGLLPVDESSAVCDGPAGSEVYHEVRRHRSGATTEQPLVMNRAAVPEALVQQGVHSLILAPVATIGHQVGWLVALNRALENPTIPAAVQRVSHEIEFGSVEAGLVQAAAALLATHARNVALFEGKEKLLIGVISAMSGAVDARDPYTHGHSRRVATYGRLIAREMGFEPRECERINVAGLLHDIGKIGVPDEILKKTGKLTDEEFDIMKQHPELGYQILQHLEDLSYVLPGVRHHHERYDGRGYPHGLEGGEIPLMARILAVADGYDAMTSTRTYRAAMPSTKAEAILRECAGTQWDSTVVEAFFRCIDKVRKVATEDPRDLHTVIMPDIRMTNEGPEIAAPRGTLGSQ